MTLEIITSSGYRESINIKKIQRSSWWRANGVITLAPDAEITYPCFPTVDKEGLCFRAKNIRRTFFSKRILRGKLIDAGFVDVNFLLYL